MNMSHSISLLSISRYLLYIFLAAVSIASLSYSIGGLRVSLFNLTGAVYLAFIFLTFLYMGKIKIYQKKIILIPIFLLTLVLISEILSILGLIYSLPEASFQQFTKLLFNSIFLKLALVAFLLHQAATNFKYSDRLLFFYLLCLGVSCLYQMMAIFSAIALDTRLDEIFWPLVTFGAWEQDLSGLDFGTAGGAYSFTVRHGGFAINPNLHAAILICAIPLTILLGTMRSRFFIWIAGFFTLSLLFTISRSGIAVLVLSFIFFFVRQIFKSPAKMVKFIIYSSVVIFSIGWLFEYYEIFSLVEIIDTAFRRSLEGGYFESSRYFLLLAAYDMLSQSPILGVGLGNAPVLLENYPIYQISGPSLHNYWVSIMVERGVFFFPIIFYYFYLFITAFKIKGPYSQALGISLLALAGIGLFNNSLASIQIQIFLLLIYCASIKDTTVNKTYHQLSPKIS